MPRSGQERSPCVEGRGEEYSRTNQITAAIETKINDHRTAVNMNVAVTAGHSNLNCRSFSPRSIIQCQAVCAVIADRMMVPMRSATTYRNKTSSEGISSDKTRT